ncbi:hypothetical protein ACH5RR_017585 [Cinchona calisaya]|uniref:Stigma-specific STIG1-like protein 1 n=1 Tax=Cinchona calisaya TaxID=153742 RepID=A0ABD2ZJ37_9GENT
MKCTKFPVLFALVMAIAITINSAASTIDESFLDKNEDSEAESFPELNESSPISLRGTSRFVAQKSRAKMTCNKYPRVCSIKGSPGPDCCKKKCVNVLMDRFNCGICGKKCKYSEICCEGECVNPWSNRGHCGSCNNKCKKGSSCAYGMCSYA